MSFHLTSGDVHVDGHTIHGKLHRTNGESVDAHYDLDTCIGNKDGHFEWGGKSN